MKKTFAALASSSLLLLSSSPEAFGASIAVQNLDNNGLVFVDSDGVTALTSGFVALYRFGLEGSPLTPADAAALQANGLSGSLGIVTIDNGVTFGSGGAFASAFTGFDNTVTNANLFLVIGNGADLASSSALAMLDVTGHTFLSGSETPAAPQVLEPYIINEANDVLIGTATMTTSDFNWQDALGQNPFTARSLILSPVPEPSSALLASLGLLALSARRSRK